MYPRRFATAIVAAMVAAATLGVSGAVGAPSRQGDLARGSAGPPPMAVPAAGTFYPVPSLRLLGTDTGYALAAGSSVGVTPVGRPGLPSSGVSAVMVNVTAVAGAADAAVTLGPSGAPPATPLVAAPAGTTRSVLLTVPLAAVGAFDVGAATGAVSVTADLVGFYAADDTVVASQGVSGGYQPVGVTRVFDTDSRAPLAAGARQVVSVDLGSGVDAHTTALLLRATAKNAAAAGSLVVTGAAPGTPATNAVSFAAASPATNLALVPTGGAQDRVDITVTNASAGATGVALDLVGFYDDGRFGPNLRFRPLPQTQVVDTRSGVGTGSLLPGRLATLTADDKVAGDSTFGLVGVATSAPAAATDVSVDSSEATSTDDLPLPAGTSSTAVVTEVGATRSLALQTRSSVPLDLHLDVTGSFEAYPPVTHPAARGWVPAVPSWQISAVAR